ncbi:Uu.00g020510.m01.CDS01 [Anthostomella pinea]|uniref:Uu.00g020510.m01.CDS01 n=1 Tax=Anthostomella pinea TaxID=933095 RepID=A0AAI8VZH6_9PEZI|nr:Uu.00g020510.m01.CDS01 [Anthostomella pinea]
MFSSTAMTAGLFALTSKLVHALGPFKFCGDNECGSCSVQVTDAGTGYPNCVVYSTQDVFGGQDEFNGSDSGGFAPFMDVPKPDDGCEIIIKSPASTRRAGCGHPIGSYKDGVCAALELDTTFMVQFCCGTGDCQAALPGSQRSVRFDPMYLSARSGGGGGMYLLRQDGTQIEPLEEGYASPATTDKEKREDQPPSSTPSSSDQKLPHAGNKRDDECPSGVQAKRRDLQGSSAVKRECKPDKKSWVADGEDYTRPADSTSIVLADVDGGTGGSTETVSHERSQTWTTSASASLGFADVLSLGVSFTQEYSCEISDTKSYQFSIPAGQVGDVGFTAYLDCQTGTYTCDGDKSDPVEFCAPYKDNDGLIAGIYAVIAHT